MLASGLVLLGFALFAVDEMKRGSKNQQNVLQSALGDVDESPAGIASSARIAARSGANMLPKQRVHGGDWRTA